MPARLQLTTLTRNLMALMKALLSTAKPIPSVRLLLQRVRRCNGLLICLAAALATPSVVDAEPLDVWLLACLAGTQHRPRPFLLAMLAAHPELPPMRVLPASEHDAPGHLGYTKLPASGMPDSYRTEAFQPLSIAVTEAVGQVLASPPSDIRLELRPGRLLLAAPAWTKDKPGELLEVGAKLTLALQ